MQATVPDKYTALWVSHSSISDFLKCPRSYFLKNVYKNPATARKISLMQPPLALGQAVHAVIESLSLLPVYERLQEPLLKKFELAWDVVSGVKGGFATPEEEEEYKRRGKAMITQVMRNPGPIEKKAVKIRQNLPYYHLSVEDNIILCGKIDWLTYIPEDNSIHIIDFKTGIREEKVDSLQLPIYYLLATNCQKRRVSGASYWYLEKEEVLRQVPLPDRDEAYKRIVEIAKRIKTARMHREFTCPKKGCYSCNPMEEIVGGNAKHIGFDQYGRELYVLQEERKPPVSMEDEPKAYSFEKIRESYQRAYEPWTRSEDERLKDTYLALQKTKTESESSFIGKLANEFERKPGAIRSRIKKLVDQPSHPRESSGSPHQPFPVLPKLTFTPRLRQALELMEQGRKHLFIAGKAGTGKSTLLTYYRQKTEKNIAVLAPTGVAALNVYGQTIHSFFRFKPDITIEKVHKLPPKSKKRALYQNLDAILIDEVSMVRADLLDCIDAFLRLNGPDPTLPFGGVRMILIGDLHQLPPVVTKSEERAFREHYPSPYFFDSRAFSTLDAVRIELDSVYRQTDERFISILNAIRTNSFTDEYLEAINGRLVPEFRSLQDEFFIHLTTTNRLADLVNREHIDSLPGKLYTYEAEITGNFGDKSFPTEEHLSIKVGAQVMMVNNDARGRWVNGSVGAVDRIEQAEERNTIRVRLKDGDTVDVTPYTWELVHQKYNERERKMTSEFIGSFTQYPLILAWAVTIHKSQGKTFDRVIIDVGDGTFVPGQLYVALSRCTSLDGIILKRKITREHIFLDERVVQFMKR